MRPASENDLSKYESHSAEITPNTDKSVPGKNSSEDYNYYNSEESLYSGEEKSIITESLTNKKNKEKLKFRSSSVCIDDEVVAGSPSQKGILKYNISRFRSFSESCSEHYSISLSNNGESISALDELFEESEDQESENQKVKKTVRFSDKVHKQLFRSTSSILGQRKKNQRKQASKKIHKAHTHHANQGDRHDQQSSSNATSEDDLSGIGDGVESLTLSDSGIEAEDSDFGSTTNVAQHTTNETTARKNKKQKRNKNNRRRVVSESSATDMIFDLDF